MAEMAHDSRAVANKILQIARRQGLALTVMQLLKLLYLAHGWSLALRDQALVSEPVEAWQYGPVYPAVYRAFNQFGSSPITDLATDRATGLPMTEEFDSSEESILESTVRVYGKMHAFRLSDMMHQPGTPWTITFNESGPYSVIPQDRIKEHFLKAARNERVAG